MSLRMRCGKDELSNAFWSMQGVCKYGHYHKRRDVETDMAQELLSAYPNIALTA